MKAIRDDYEPARTRKATSSKSDWVDIAIGVYVGGMAIIITMWALAALILGVGLKAILR